MSQHTTGGRRLGWAARTAGTAAVLASLAACSGGTDDPTNAGAPQGGDDAPAGELVLYSSMTENDLNVLQGLLEDKFPGIELEIVNGSAGELTTRMQSESGNPQGDFMWGGLDMGDGDRYSDIFEHYVTQYDADLPEAYRSPNGFYNVDHLSTVAFAVNKDLAADLGVTVNSYEDLLDPRLNGKIVMADPTSSSSAWNNLQNILTVYGQDTDAPWDYVGKLLDNGLVIAGSSSVAFTGVEEGEYVVGLTYEDGIASMMKSGSSHTELVYPSNGTSASAFATAVVKGAPHMELAKKVVDYIMSPEGQTALGEGLSTLRMTTTAKYNSDYLPPADSITWADRDVKWLTDNHDALIDRWIDVFTAKRG